MGRSVIGRESGSEKGKGRGSARVRWRWLVYPLLLALGGLSFFLDDTVRHWVGANPSPIVRKAAGWISDYGDWPELMLAGLVLIAWGYFIRSRHWRRTVAVMIIASTLAGALVNVSRLTTGRTRPRADAEQGWYGVRHEGEWLIGRNTHNSFPSGHTATAVGFAAPLFLYASPFTAAVGATFAASVIWSRLYLGAHHFSDVVFAVIIVIAATDLLQARLLPLLVRLPRFKPPRRRPLLRSWMVVS